jgi:hypothetical protein
MSKISDMQAELRAIKAETSMFAMKETQGIVNAVQGGLNQRIEKLAARLALTERDVDRMKGGDSSATRLHLPAPGREASWQRGVLNARPERDRLRLTCPA